MNMMNLRALATGIQISGLVLALTACASPDEAETTSAALNAAALTSAGSPATPQTLEPDDASASFEVSPQTNASAPRCPAGCYEANVSCTGFLLWNACFCFQEGRQCAQGGWWVGGGC